MLELFRDLFRRKENGLAVLMYHRIANLEQDPWEIGVSPVQFEQHIKMLGSEYEILSSEKIIERWAARDFRNPAICITFDDAYLDNFERALPVLKKYNCPATFFVPSGFLQGGKYFWWDELESSILNSSELPPLLTFKVRGVNHKFEFSSKKLSEKEISQQKSWVYHEKFPTSRCSNFFQIWDLIRPLTNEEISEIIMQIRVWAKGTVPLSPIPRVMKRAELSLLAANPLFSVGVHTRHHSALPFHSSDYQSQQIGGCKSDLEELLKKNISSLAFPYGLYNSETLKVSKELHFESGFTTNAVTLNSSTGPLESGRFQVRNISGSRLKKELESWLN